MEHVLLLFLILSSAKAYFISEEECLDYTIYPVQYEITIFPYIYDDRSFSYDCDMNIAFIVNVGSVTVIELDAMDMDIDENSIEVFEGRNKHNLIDAGRHFQYDKTRGKVYIYLKNPLKEYRLSKTQYLLRMKFRKFLNFDSTGVFVVRHRENGLKYMLTTRLSPNKAKYFIPCFDNPRFEAVFKFKVYIRPPPSDIITTNTSLVIAKEQKITRFKDGVVLIEYIPSPQVALHQLGFHLSDFKNRRLIAKNTNDTLVIWAPESKLHDYTFIMNFGESIINLIHYYASVNRPLVYGPINIVSVPTHMQGYEIDSWNLLTNSATRLEYKFEDTSIRQVEIMFFDLAQQLSRIWLGNPGEIERTRWKEEWFKEGVATYLAYYFLAQYKHGADAMKQRWPLDFYGIDMRNKAMAVDWYQTVPALITFNRTLAIEIPERYKEVVTMKTASILWMVENWLGSEKFHQALVKYINTRRGKFISIDDFTANLDKDTVECLNQFFNGSTSSRVLHSWFSRAGYPVVKVQVLRDRPLNAIMLKQRQFSFTKENRQDSDYMIPISYMVENNENCFNCYRPRFTIGINSYTFEENLNDGWIILNRYASGYYRVNYDDVTWKLIAKALRTNPLSIDQLNRAQIVNDVLALYIAGDLDYYLAIEILSYLDKESSYAVWHSVISGFESLKIKNAACNMNRAVYGQWQKFMSDKVSSIYNRLMSGTEDANRLFKSAIVQFACAVKHQQCLNSLKHMYRARINPDYRAAIYYMMLTENREIRNDGMNDFQIEDLKLAEHKMREEERFLHSIPHGQPMPERLMLEATTPPTYHTSTQENDLHTTRNPSSSVINVTSMFLIAVTIFVTCLL